MIVKRTYAYVGKLLETFNQLLLSASSTPNSRYGLADNYGMGEILTIDFFYHYLNSGEVSTMETDSMLSLYFEDVAESLTEGLEGEEYDELFQEIMNSYVDVSSLLPALRDIFLNHLKFNQPDIDLLVLRENQPDQQIQYLNPLHYTWAVTLTANDQWIMAELQTQ